MITVERSLIKIIEGTKADDADFFRVLFSEVHAVRVSVRGNSWSCVLLIYTTMWMTLLSIVRLISHFTQDIQLIEMPNNPWKQFWLYYE